MEKSILNVLMYVFLAGGAFGMLMGFLKVFSGASPSEYGIMGGIGGLWLLSAAIVILIQSQITRQR